MEIEKDLVIWLAVDVELMSHWGEHLQQTHMRMDLPMGWHLAFTKLRCCNPGKKIIFYN